jgi:hypothetical protein
MPTIIEQIKDRVQHSDIPLPDKEKMLQLFSRASLESLEMILHLFNQNPSWIDTINHNIQIKWKALMEKDADAWKRILKEEEEQLKALE